MWSAQIGSSNTSNRERIAGYITRPVTPSPQGQMEPTAPDAEPVQHGHVSDVQIKVTLHGSALLGRCNDLTRKHDAIRTDVDRRRRPRDTTLSQPTTE
jgi:hypothetical protein